MSMVTYRARIVTRRSTQDALMPLPEFKAVCQCALLLAMLSSLALYTLPCASADWSPRTVALTFALKAFGSTVGETRWRIEQTTAGEWRYTSVTEPSGLYALIRSDVVREISHFSMQGTQIIPRQYRYSRTGGKRDRTVSVAFDWTRNRVENTAKGQTWSMAVPAGTQDKLSYLLAVTRDLAKGQRELSYQVADGGKLKTYRLQVAGEDTVETALGDLRALRVERLNQSKRHTQLWFAPAMAHLPVKVAHREKDGSELMLIITSVSGLDRP
ncbi:MAG: DUF3108 domain-containing protein [Gammaproteobacteria bacterium]|nr:DUF3108 domain-containing protein [Gammaproteobacteria bacterium]